MEVDYNVNDWATPCPKYDCKKTACVCGLEHVSIPPSLEDEYKPEKGAFYNAIVEYKGSGRVYIYSKEGIPVLVRGNDAS